MNQIEQHDKDRLVKVSGIGKDRRGIVNKIANIIAQSGGNIILQRSMLVAGEFAVVAVVSWNWENTGGMQNVLNEFNKAGILGENFIIFARETTLSSIAQATQGGTKYAITIRGDDQVGIVDAMTLLLLQNNLNLYSMDSEVVHQPFQGTVTFSSTFVIVVPDGFDMDAFSVELDQFTKNYDLSVEEILKVEESSKEE